MTMLDASDDKQLLEKIISEMPRVPTIEKAKEMYDRKELKDGEVFMLTDVEGHWKAGVWVMSKMPFVDYDLGLYDARRLEVLKRKGIAHLLHIAETKWVPTATMPYLPQRYQNIETGQILFTARAVDASIEDARHESAQIDPEFMAKGSENTGQVKIEEEDKVEMEVEDTFDNTKTTDLGEPNIAKIEEAVSDTAPAA